MACYPQSAAGLNYITYPVGPAVAAIALTADAAANTKGAYTTIAASTAFTCNRVGFVIVSCSNTNSLNFLCDVATGAGGAEVIVIPDILAANYNAAASFPTCLVDIPLAIPSGTRIAGRCACTTGGSGLNVGITLTAAGGCPSPTTYLNYGAVAGDSGGTGVDPGGVANTKGAYSEITASTSAVAQVLLVMWHNRVNTGSQTIQDRLDIATGAGGAEVVLIPDLFLVGRATAGISLAPLTYTFLTYIPASTRIAARASCNITDATDRLLDVALLAATAPAEASGGGSFAFA